jgi:hypothetical protein
MDGLILMSDDPALGAWVVVSAFIRDVVRSAR